MERVRPIARDSRMGSGWPVVASRYAHDDRAAPCRTPVTHSDAVLSFYTGGRTRVEQNGEWHVHPGDVLLVPAGMPHRTLEMQGGELWGMSFCVPLLVADGAASLLEPFERVRDGGSAVVHIPSARHAFLEELFRELAEVGREPRGPSVTLDAVQRACSR